MQSLDIDKLHSLRLSIFDNAEELHKEAALLLQNKVYSRAYLLAYFCFEELGKIPIIVGAIGKLVSGGKVDWKKLQKRFYSHTAKIESQNTHYYTFGLDLDLLRDSDLKWLDTAQSMVPQSFEMKNAAMYVDVKNSEILLPSRQVSKAKAEEIVNLAFGCLQAHWRSESLTNPLLVAIRGLSP